MSIIQGTAKGGSTGFYDYPIENSLRFDGSSYLSRTPTTAGNRQTWTWSGWVKRGTLGTSTYSLFGAYLNDDNRIYLNISNHVLGIFGKTTAVTNISVNNGSTVFRDPSAWYHIVCVVDTTESTGADRVKFYINGTQQSLTFSTTPSPNADLYINTAEEHIIGELNGASYFDGYLANIQFIDGQALDASYFGETKQDIWVPKIFDGTSSTGGSTVSTDYGTNGFLLDFSSISGTTINDTAPIDTNHSSANNWTATGF